MEPKIIRAIVASARVVRVFLETQIAVPVDQVTHSDGTPFSDDAPYTSSRVVITTDDPHSDLMPFSDDTPYTVMSAALSNSDN